MFRKFLSLVDGSKGEEENYCARKGLSRRVMSYEMDKHKASDENSDW